MLELNKIYCMDCVNGMKQLDDESINMIFVDPPFNVGKNYGEESDDGRKDYFEWCDMWIKECFRLLKNTGSIYLMNISKNIGYIMRLMDKHGVFLNLIIWKNVCSWGSKNRFYHKHQPILFYAKTDDYYFDTYAQREKPFARWGSMSGKMQGQMWDIWLDIPFVWAGSTHHKEAILQCNSNSKAHPTQMPLDLVKRAILFSTKETETVLDPFMGSGTTAVAAKHLNRNFIGFEISKDYCKIAEKRLAQETFTSFLEMEKEK